MPYVLLVCEIGRLGELPSQDLDLPSGQSFSLVSWSVVRTLNPALTVSRT